LDKRVQENPNTCWARKSKKKKLSNQRWKRTNGERREWTGGKGENRRRSSVCEIRLEEEGGEWGIEPKKESKGG